MAFFHISACLIRDLCVVGAFNSKRSESTRRCSPKGQSWQSQQTLISSLLLHEKLFADASGVFGTLDGVASGQLVVVDFIVVSSLS